MSEDRRGIDRLREAIESVASEIEERPARGGLRIVLAAAAVLVLALLGSWLWIAPSGSSDVEILVLKVRGREMNARIVDDTAAATIIVIPQTGGTR